MKKTLILLIMTLLLSGCGRLPLFEPAQTKPERTIYLPKGTEGLIKAIYMIAGSLAEPDPESSFGVTRFVGALAEDLPSLSEDGLTWSFRIREGLTLSNGSAADAFTIRDRLVRGMPNSPEYRISGIHADNRLMLRIVTPEPVPLPLLLSWLDAFLVNDIYLQMEAKGNLLDIPTLGLFRVHSASSTGLILETDNSYPTAYKHANERVYIVYDNEQYTAPKDTPWFIFINSEHNPALADANLRKALYFGLNREAALNKDIIKEPYAYFVPPNAIVGDARTGLSPYNTTPEASASRLPYGAYNPRLALEYFDAAYQSNGNQLISVTITCFDELEEWGKLAIHIRDCWMELFGAERFHLLLELKPTAEAYADYATGAYELGFGAYTAADADIWASMAVWTLHYPNRPLCVTDPEFDALQYDSALGSLRQDYAAKIPALARMEEILFETMPAIPVFVD